MTATGYKPLSGYSTNCTDESRGPGDEAAIAKMTGFVVEKLRADMAAHPAGQDVRWMIRVDCYAPEEVFPESLERTHQGFNMLASVIAASSAGE